MKSVIRVLYAKESEQQLMRCCVSKYKNSPESLKKIIFLLCPRPLSPVKNVE